MEHIRLELKSSIEDYFLNLPDDVFPSFLKNKASVILSGSTGWGIKEGFDEKADRDLHILLDNQDYTLFCREFGENYVIDDHKNNPTFFGQIRNKTWLLDRLNDTLPESWPLYLWIYTRCQYILDPLNIEALIQYYQEKFQNELNELRKKYFVKFSVRRSDTSSSAQRNILIAAGINRGEMVKHALQTYSLIREQPYSYNKWLARHVESLDAAGQELVDLCNQCLTTSDMDILVKKAAMLRDFLEACMREVLGDERWISHWWEFNIN